MSNEKRSDAVTNGSQMGLRANGAEIYSGKSYHEEDERRKKAKQFSDYDAQLVSNDASNTATDRGADFAAREEILGKLDKMGAPKGVIDRVAKESLTDVYDKNKDIVNIEKDVLKFHAKKTSEFKEHTANERKQSAIDKVMQKAEATEQYDAGQSLLESKMELHK